MGFEDWYTSYDLDSDGCLRIRGVSKMCSTLQTKYRKFKQEMDARCSEYDKLEMLIDGEVISKKKDLPNVSSGDTSGMVRRIARNLVQHTPNTEIISKFDDDSAEGVFADFILRTKIIGVDTYSNDMQQNLFASVKTAWGLGFDCVIPILQQDAAGGWYVKYDTIHYRDVFPEPGAKDVRDATEVFVRRYLTKGELAAIARRQVDGWDAAAIKTLLRDKPNAPSREPQSNSHADTKRKVIAEGYEIITWYSAGGHAFLTYEASTGMLLRIEENKHPLKLHPVHFLVLEKDEQQPLGKAQAELVLGRQEFQDLMLNGAMKLWYRNINPSIIGYGTVNAIPNLSPGKYTEISNPNAKIEAFEVSTQTLLQFNAISQGNAGAMVSQVGAADQQMAQQAGNGMSATPQGVQAQQQMVDITTNNYQKAIESFFSHYCSYALTVYFQELKGNVNKITPTAEARYQLLNAGLDPEKDFTEEGKLNVKFDDMAIEYFVKCVPGSLVEMEDEKQLRVLNEMFVPLSQAMPALAATQDPELLKRAAATMEFIIRRQIELSGSNRSRDIKTIWTTGNTEQVNQFEERAKKLDSDLGGIGSQLSQNTQSTALALQQIQEQITLLRETMGEVMKNVGMEITTPEQLEQETPVVGMPAA